MNQNIIGARIVRSTRDWDMNSIRGFDGKYTSLRAELTHRFAINEAVVILSAEYFEALTKKEKK